VIIALGFLIAALGFCLVGLLTAIWERRRER
jgi:hypothetical protein